MPSPTEIASELFGLGGELDVPAPPQKTVSLRLDVEVLSYVDHIAIQAKESRQHVLSRIVQIGLSELLNATPSSIRDEIQQAVFVDLNSQE